jgi:PiT family inorganic phosphate transporter
MLDASALTVLVVLLALSFDYTNGFHDTANAIATSVATRVLRPVTAITMSAALNFLGALTSTAVAQTIGKGYVEPRAVTLQVLLAAMVAAIAWNLLTWYFGIPSSSTHALIGGILGAAVGAGGPGAIQAGAFRRVLLPLLVSPPAGFLAGLAVMAAIHLAFARVSLHRANRLFARLQVLSAAWVSFSHGMGDAQKSMGVITMALFAAHWIPAFAVPTWVKVAAATAMGLGTAGGGWRIIRTLGLRMIKLHPVQGFAAEASAALLLTTAASVGAPVSTTHVIASSITGVGAAKRFTAVRWEVVRDILWAMVLTVPAAAVLGGLLYAAVFRYL